MSETAEKPFETMEKSSFDRSTAIKGGEQLILAFEAQKMVESIFESTTGRARTAAEDDGSAAGQCRGHLLPGSSDVRGEVAVPGY
ncbi:hypothetical protein QN219_26550 [Sinorhizobium sp. 7-81]|uniref:hypothetical protein n=1 Tax=unclassified Sinorhizobium TaxID=2613772 RepID=UPI0024C37B98|nr:MULTISPECIES: hypothetical protein [unclassified Sinorhizobium]MDK1389285.1 hypothetical protein [Sinorhizobium sp. 7-81]MDK1493564.1 hypothetical protein [Sinorhizobium sp. 8-89]